MAFLGIHKGSQQLIAIGCTIVLLLLIQPLLWSLVQQRAQALQQVRSTEQQVTELARRSAVIQESVTTEEGLVGQLDAVVPPQPLLTQVVERLEQLADRNRITVSIAGIEHQPIQRRSVNLDSLLPVVITLSAEGTVNQLLTYLEQIEKTQELTTIQKWELIPTGAAPPPPVEGQPAASVAYRLRLEVVFFLRQVSDGQN